MRSINPATGEIIKTYEPYSLDRAGEIVDEVHDRFQSWKEETFATRASLMRTLAALLEERKTELAALMTREMGKITSEAVGEIEKCAWVCRYYAEHGESFLQDEEIPTDLTRSFITYQPIGVVLAVMPWNFPFWQVFRFAAPALVGGNVGVLKHSSNVTGCALAIENLVREAGFPDNCFRTLLVPSEEMEKVIEHPKVRAVTLTGSVPAGAAVAEIAGRNLKKTVLELGGSDPYLVLEDADLELAADKCTQSRLLNAGQSCIAAKRFIVVEQVYADFLEAFTQKMGQRRLGPPDQEDTTLGPQASKELRDELHQQVEASVQKGARLMLGGEIPDGEGAYYPATVLADVRAGMPAYSEELFGPVASVIKVRDTEEAIRVANDSEFGLGGGIFTRDLEKGLDLARRRIDTGCCAVNDFVKSNPHLPFGGVKKSGYGRELSHLGIREFMNIKTVTL